LDPYCSKFIVIHYYVTTALVLEAFYDLDGQDLFLIRLRDLFIFDRAQVTGAELPETNLLLARGRINCHRNINQTEANTAFPDGAHWWECSFHSSGEVSNASRSVCRITLQLRETV